MSGKNISFDDKKIRKSDFYKNKTINKIDNINVNNIMLIMLIMSFRVKDKQLLKNYNKIRGKIEKLMKIDFESKPVYGDDDKHIKSKLKTYEKSIITNFHNKKNA